MSHPGHMPLQDLYRQAQAHAEPAARVAASEHGGRASSRWECGRPMFVGRASSLQALQSVWQRCTRGSGQLALVTGEAGISKTRLVEEWLARLARQGIAVATTHCFVGGEAIAYAPLAELFRNAAPFSSLAVSNRFGPARSHACCLNCWPEIRRWRTRSVDEKLAAPAFLQALTQARAWHRSVTNSTGDQQDPLALFIDDLQWCDGETLGACPPLMHAAANSPLLVLATLRTEELGQQNTWRAFCWHCSTAANMQSRNSAPSTIWRRGGQRRRSL